MEEMLEYLKNEKILIPQDEGSEEESALIPNVLCHLSKELPLQQWGYAYGTLMRKSRKLILRIEESPTYNFLTERTKGTIEIEDVAAVEFTKLSDLLPFVNIVAIKRHMHPPIYFRYFARFTMPFFGKVEEMNQQIFNLCEGCITKLEENEYCKNELVKISAIKNGCALLGKEPEFCEIGQKEFDSLFFCYSILTKLQPEDDIRLFTLLVESGLDITKPVPGWVNETTFKTSLVNFAVKKGLKLIVEYLYQQGVDINKKFLGQAPIHIACLNKNVEMCKLLYTLQADINCTTDWGDSPLSISLQYDDIVTIQFLVQSGATVSYENLSVAVNKENLAIVRTLVEAFFMQVENNDDNLLTSLLEQCANNDIKEYLISKGAIEQKNSCALQ